jgi:hypothetical protein
LIKEEFNYSSIVNNEGGCLCQEKSTPENLIKNKTQNKMFNLSAGWYGQQSAAVDC